jgi:hypothetical protein
MKQTTCAFILTIMTVYGTHASAYSGELWLSQANQDFGTPASVLAHGFLAGVVHSWNKRREQNFPKLCFNAPADQMQIRNLMDIVKNYISDRDPDLKAPAQGVIRVAMMGRFPCRKAN